MGKQTGFTLIELMVVVAILGILAVTAVPFYQTFQQRAYGSQASIIMKSLMDAQIMYYLDHNSFYPPQGEDIFIPYEGQGSPSPEGILAGIEENLKVKLVQSANLGYFVTNYGEAVTVTIEAPFRLFKGGGVPGTLIGNMTKDGQVTYVGPPPS